jgi:HSP20 family protein
MSSRTVSRRTRGTSSSTTQLANPQPTALSTGFDNIFEQFRRSIDELMAPFYPFTGLISPVTAPITQLPTRASVVDLLDEGDHYVVTAELPGFSKDQVDVQVNKYGLIIRAQRSAENEQKDKNYLYRERAYSAFERTIDFPEEVLPQKVEGTMKDGILRLQIPKKEPNPEERLTKVQIK